MEHFDVVVVGAGPVGSHAARLLAEAGHRILLVEEHPEVGHPVQCAGLVTLRTFDHTPFGVEEVHQNNLHGAQIYSPDGQSISFRTKAIQAVAMDRALFDQKMAAAAATAGAELRVQTKAVSLVTTTGGARITMKGPDGKYEVSCQMVVGADGIRSNVAKWSGLPPVQEVVSCYEAELVGCTVPDEAMIPMFSGKQRAPGFFSWIIPVGDDRTRTGLAVAPGMNEAAAKAYYQAMFSDELSRSYIAASAENYLIVGGIPLGLRRRLVADRVAVVGDAAGMAKPTSGGGIHTGLVAAEELVKVLNRLLPGDNLSRGHLLPYERRVRRTIARELRKGEVLREIYKKFRDEDFNTLSRLLAKPQARAVIERIGDIDYPSRLVLPLLLAQPKLIGLFAKVMLQGAQ